ncbi:hypothetical protein HNQ87_002436 [Pacificimonas flava]|uniref:Uncharacterized protein n=1 Tax=Pacificimonas flava TaxID=1234595 RepID=M2TL92_9SPHN|nr:hypothetical protein C725_2147 [Pacificimonas flava]MBB5281260.1 hypothetical protein [Pacificimonas flava]
MIGLPQRRLGIPARERNPPPGFAFESLMSGGQITCGAGLGAEEAAVQR